MDILRALGIGSDPIEDLKGALELKTAKEQASKCAAKVVELREIRKRDYATLMRVKDERDAARFILEDLLRTAALVVEAGLIRAPRSTEEQERHGIFFAAMGNARVFINGYKDGA